ncbi:hypothetical protein EYF80_047555 [Liparis tanakae]|uniref:Uncharacterized protein n=1 Tax=Liparis tanakae TaxID=230148 RepID=A0A4Z2FN36_9TELE|nr:hypothetical protein EYF80_047555 [Liparis tanakae]
MKRTQLLVVGSRSLVPSVLRQHRGILNKAGERRVVVVVVVVVASHHHFGVHTHRTHGNWSEEGKPRMRRRQSKQEGGRLTTSRSQYFSSVALTQNYEREYFEYFFRHGPPHWDKHDTDSRSSRSNTHLVARLNQQISLDMPRRDEPIRSDPIRAGALSPACTRSRLSQTNRLSSLRLQPFGF